MELFSPHLALLYTAIVALFIIVPGRVVRGYIIDPATKDKYRYRLNGLLVLWITLASASLLVYWDYVPANIMYAKRWPMIITANIIGLLCSALFYIIGDTKAKFKPTHLRESQFKQHNVIVRGVLDFYSGLEDDPHWRHVADFVSDIQHR